MYKLHGVFDWGSQVIHLALAELQLPFEFHQVDVEAGGLQASEFLALNPFGRVPVLETPDGPMFETAAILLYLAETHGALAPAPGAPDRAAFLIWFVLVTNTMHPLTLTLLHPERPGGETVAAAVADETHRQLRRHLAVLETVASAGWWWLSPERPSILSLFLVMLLRWIRAFPAYAHHSIVLADYPALHAMAKGLETRPRLVAALQAEGLSGAVYSDPPCETLAGETPVQPV